MMQAKKTKTKFIERNLFDFKYVKINFRYDNRDDRDERNNKNIKKIFITNIITIMKIDI